ncbi:16352_t:CDS:1 [Acaulospora morrowiae]|uniref:16352_t:CDS:1 n=1 Tax=Acaulospora morrowiae TaxID=94023 RepID=A0A9N9C9K9_9GLOM|nr:16352_t:CDS:1 [Acaulospora morrowiae]
MNITIKEHLRKTPNKLSENLKLKRKEVKHTQMSINTLRAIVAQLGVRNIGSKAELIEKIIIACLSIAEHKIYKLEEEPEHSLLQQYQDSTDLEDIRMQEETEGDWVIRNNRQLKRTKSISASENLPY